MQSSHGKMDKSGKCFAKKIATYLPLKCIMPSMMMQAIIVCTIYQLCTLIFGRKFQNIGAFFKGQKD